MKLMPMGDFYVWYCEWCDTRNLTLWAKVEKNKLCCAACQKKFTESEEAALPAKTRHGSDAFRMAC